MMKGNTMTIEEFMQDDQPIRNKWLKHPEFKALYVRKGKMIYYFKGDLRDKEHKIDKVIQLANFEAKKPGTGAFSRLLNWLRVRYPEHTIYVENALEERFARHLLMIGFLETSTPECFVLSPEMTLIEAT
jgi:hypothetical protein